MGGGSSSQQANTTTNANSSTSVGGSIGFTGAQGLQAIKIFRGIFADAEAYSAGVIAGGYQFSGTAINNNLSLTGSTAGGIIDASRDFSQRAISASTGQATPIVNLAGASQPKLEPAGGNVQSGLSLSPALLVAVAGLGIGIFALTRK